MIGKDFLKSSIVFFLFTTKFPSGIFILGCDTFLIEFGWSSSSESSTFSFYSMILRGLSPNLSSEKFSPMICLALCSKSIDSSTYSSTILLFMTVFTPES